MSDESVSVKKSPDLSARGRSSATSTFRDQVSRHSTSQEGNERALSPRRGNYSHKRAEEPHRNEGENMICEYAECGNITFERKCEWNKHMDKHERPYKCHLKDCEKLQGFTYSGGLLRHEREVHKMHGGTNKSLFCPFLDCKRGSGLGFTRKENLAEHMRRVHRLTSTSSDPGNQVMNRSRETEEEDSLQLGPDKSRSMASPEEGLRLKRKRTPDPALEEDEMDLRVEVKRLRKENDKKEATLQQQQDVIKALQAAVSVLQQGKQ